LPRDSLHTRCRFEPAEREATSTTYGAELRTVGREREVAGASRERTSTVRARRKRESEEGRQGGWGEYK
jgi:hypothetical protein